ncbi:PAM [Bugula neritina]|uniref:PAM n=1 Tax=Bugula neritina TaxID=10212 RepID=A0A7J7JSH6_BUGNE|nr:PAM [Bugula neritina]
MASYLLPTMLSLCLIFCLHFSSATQSKMEIRMPNLRPSVEDYYVCTSIKVPSETYITQYEALADAGTAHHILLFGCDEPFSYDSSWECGATCKKRSSIMFAWAKNADPTKLPPDVGYHIGGHSGVNYIVMQVHYARALTKDDPPDQSGIALYTSTIKPNFTQGIFLMAANIGSIPPKQTVIYVCFTAAHLDVSCYFKSSKTIHPFAFRTHAHSLSTVISAYKRPAGHPQAKWEELGKGNPQWPQAFYPMKTKHTIQYNDIVVARCVYNSTSRDTDTHVGSKHTDEMCNFYMMYYTKGEAEYLQCGGNRIPSQAKDMPASSFELLPPNPKLDEQASGHHHHDHHGDGSSNSAVMTEVKGWYKAPADLKVGQVGGVDTNSEGHLVMFHRGSHVWDAAAFDGHEVYAKQADGAITENTLVEFNSSGNAIDSWGDNLFYLPHGITIDKDDNIWLTDVALHQVFKFTPANRNTPSLTLGQRFKPGSTETSFCKPTDVAVLSDGGFFVSDGYCNGRIMRFDKDGHLVRQWGSMAVKGLFSRKPAPNQFTVVHSLALDEARDLLCAADRNNNRMQCFQTESEFLYEYDASEGVFAIASRPKTGDMVMVTSNQNKDSGHLHLLRFSATSAELGGTFTPAEDKFHVLHDVAVSSDGSRAYIAQLSPPYVYQFSMSAETDSRQNSHQTHTFMGSSHREGSSVSSQNVPIVVAVMLIVPIACILITLLIYKIYTQKVRGSQGKFDMGNIFSGGTKRGDRVGFSPLATNEDQYTDDEDELSNEKQTFVVRP